MIPTAKNYFCGAGLMAIGLQQAGIEIIQSVDLDKRAIMTMRMNPHYFSHRTIWGDIKEMTVLDQPKSDIHVYTYPCKKYSLIGEIHGVRTGDELYMHAFRHFALEQPEMFVVENVPGMKHFKVVMEAMTKFPSYYITVFCPIDAALWLPQRRERLFIIGTKKPFNICAPSPAAKKPSIKEILEKDPVVHVNDSVWARVNGAYRDKPIVVDPEDNDSIAPTCVAHYSKDMGTRLVKDPNYKGGLRPFTIREYARLMGVPDDFVLPKRNFSYELLGNGVAVPAGRWIGEQAIKYFNKS
ncbi:MAG: DNA cytosine methyltransferase [Chitinophagales bacterium]|nr:DNA cytosine methyltransferase [Chitinophagales bacterium]